MFKKIKRTIFHIFFLPPIALYLLLFDKDPYSYEVFMYFFSLWTAGVGFFKDIKNKPERLLPLYDQTSIHIYCKNFDYQAFIALFFFLGRRRYFVTVINFLHSSSFLSEFFLMRLYNLSKIYRKNINGISKYIDLTITSDEDYFTYWKKHKNCISLSLICKNGNEVFVFFEEKTNPYIKDFLK